MWRCLASVHLSDNESFNFEAFGESAKHNRANGTVAFECEERGENGGWVESFVATALVFGMGSVVGAVARLEFGVFLGV